MAKTAEQPSPSCPEASGDLSSSTPAGKATTTVTSADTELKGPPRTPVARQRLILLAGLLALAGLALWFQSRALASTRDTHATALRRLDQMRTDAQRIKTLRQTPKSAASRTRANEELLAQVERSLAAADIDRTHWHDSIPQPPIRLPNSDYKRLTTHLYFESVTLRQLATFGHNLQARDPTLHISALNLTNRHPDNPTYDADLAVSYLVYAPRAPGSHAELGR